jgi:putative transposase
MGDANRRQGRRSIRLRSHDYSSPGEYFVTLCTQDRETRFGEILGESMQLNDVGAMVDGRWRELPAKFATIEIGPYVVMPNHVHGVIVLDQPDATPCTASGPDLHPALGAVVQWFKTMTTNEYIRRVREGTWPPFRKRLWQRNYWEHIIRDEADLADIETYIECNPGEWAWDRENRQAIQRIVQERRRRDDR